VAEVLSSSSPMKSRNFAPRNCRPDPCINMCAILGTCSFMRKSWSKSTTASHIKSSKEDTPDNWHRPRCIKTSFRTPNLMSLSAR